MQGCVDLLPYPPKRTEATFCRVSGGDSDAWRPHPKVPAGPGPASGTGGRPARHRQHHGHTIGNRVTSALDFGVSQPSDSSWATCRFRTPGRWQTSSRSTDLFAAGRTRRPLGTLGSTPSALAKKWERGESGCPPGGSQWPLENGWRSDDPDLVSAIRPASAAFSPHTRCDQHMLKPSELRSHPTLDCHQRHD